MHKTALKLLKHPNNDQYYKVGIVKLFTSIIEYKSDWPSFLKALAYFSILIDIRGKRNDSNNCKTFLLGVIAKAFYN